MPLSKIYDSVHAGDVCCYHTTTHRCECGLCHSIAACHKTKIWKYFKYISNIMFVEFTACMMLIVQDKVLCERLGIFRDDLMIKSLFEDRKVLFNNSVHYSSIVKGSSLKQCADNRLSPCCASHMCNLQQIS